jgi:glucosyl-dolichyl phosphate glucuronosyltransferase
MRNHSFSVVICVYTEDRWDEICKAAESIRTQSFPSTELILVVDHNPALYERLKNTLPDVIVVENREARGLSGARNTGVALAQGEIIAFLDDDAAAHPDWLKFLNDAYANPAVMGVGGLTVPRWQTARPSWLPAEFFWVIACNYTGMPDSGLPVRNLIGVNMSFRREAFELVDEGFRTGVGRIAGKRPLGCEETEFCIKLGQRAPGSILVTEQRAIASHWVPDNRCRFSYFMSRCFAEGISKAQVAAEVGQGDGLSSERRYVTRTLPLGVAKGVADLLRGDFGGPGRSAAIVMGLSATAAGYIAARSKALKS